MKKDKTKNKAQAAMSVAEEIDQFHTIFHAILRGERPELQVPSLLVGGEKPDRAGKEHTVHQRAVRQLEHMYEDNCLTDFPGTYAHISIHKDDSTAPYGYQITTGGTAAKKDTRFHPVPLEVIERIQKLRAILDESGYADVYVIGQHLLARNNNRPPADATYGKYRAFVLPSVGDIAMAEELTRILSGKLHGNPDFANKYVIIQGKSGLVFWRPILASYGKELDTTLEHASGLEQWRGIPIESALHRIVTAASSEMMPTILPFCSVARSNVQPAPTTPVLKPGATLLIATKTREKIEEIRQRFEGTNVQVVRLDSIVNFRNVKEASGTFAGNAYEKMNAAQEALHTYAKAVGPETFRKQLQGIGINPDNMYVLSEDSGLHLKDERVLPEMGLDTMGMQPGYVFNAKHYPGVEFGPAMNSALGEHHFWEKVNAAFDRIDTKYPTQAMREVFSTSVLALSKVRWDGKPEFAQFFSAEVPNMVISHPRPADDDVITTEHFEVPSGQHPWWLRHSGATPEAFHTSPSDYMTRAEMRIHKPEEWARISQRGLAVEALMRANGILDETGKIRDAYEDRRSKPRTNFARKSIAVIGDEALRVQAQFFESEHLDSDNLAKEDAWKREMKHMEHEAQAFVFTPFHDPGNHQLFERIYSFFSAMVARQIHPRDMDKPMLVFNQNGIWDPIIHIYDHMRNLAMVSDQPRALIQEVSTLERLEKAVEALIWSRNPSLYSEEPDRPLHIRESGCFNVAVFCSATARNKTLNDESFQLGQFLGKNQFGLVFGAGDKEMMGSVFRGAHESGAWVGGSSVKHIMEVECEDSAALKSALSDYFAAPTIYDRMEYMIRTADVFAVIPGGAGTIQELAALLMLKKAGHPMMQDKEIVLLNSIEINGVREEFYKPLLDLLPRDQWEQLGVHVCSSMDQVQQQLAAIRTQKLGADVPPTRIAAGGYMHHAYGPYGDAPVLSS